MIDLCAALAAFGLALYVINYAAEWSVQKDFAKRKTVEMHEHVPQSPMCGSDISLSMLDDERKEAFYRQVDRAYRKLVDEVKEKNREGYRILHASNIDDFASWSHMYRLRLKNRYSDEVDPEECDGISFYNSKIEAIAERFKGAGIAVETSFEDSHCNSLHARRKQLTLTW